jgi:hypothetical protein
VNHSLNCRDFDTLAINWEDNAAKAKRQVAAHRFWEPNATSDID